MKRFTFTITAFIVVALLGLATTTAAQTRCATGPCLKPATSSQFAPVLALTAIPQLAQADTPSATPTNTITLTPSATPTSVPSPTPTAISTTPAATSTQVPSPTSVPNAPTTSSWQVAVINGCFGLLTAALWPGIVLLVLWGVKRYRQPFMGFFEKLVPNISKVSVGQYITLELTPAAQLPSEVEPIITKVQKPTSGSYINSDLRELFNELQNKKIKQLDHIVVDLGSGESWLTSRLYLFAVVLEKTKDLRTIVFLHSDNNIPGRFLGMASPKMVSSALAKKYPFLEQAFHQALAVEIDNLLNPATRLYNDHTAESEILSDASAQFLELIRETPQNAPDPQSGAWAELKDSPDKVEFGQWISLETFDDQIGYHILNFDHYTVKEFRNWSDSEKQKAVLRCPGPFVAKLEYNNVFVELYDRENLADKFIEQQISLL